ncbi:hypothetical protein RGUI_3917 [Rhodovulum sp. P5]|nr:hypothetical protein RGUI_3917 [Rhodovulum sp. P5]
MRAHVILSRGLEVSGEGADLVSRLPADAPEKLAKRLAHATARLEFHDPRDGRFFPGAGVARSVLFPLAYAVGGMVEDIDNGRLFYFPFPEPEGVMVRLKRSLDEVRMVLGLR